MEKARKVLYYQTELEMKVTDFSHISMVRDRFSKIVELWTILTEWDKENVIWINQPVLEINLEEVATKVSAYKKKISKLYELFRDQKSLSRLCSVNMSAINNFDTNYLDLMNTLLHESFKDRHWKELLLEIYRGFEPPKLEILTFKNLIDKKIRSFKSLITILAEKAQNQYIVEFKIDDIQRSICSTQLVIRTIDRASQLVISNVQTVRGTFIEHRNRCDQMMITSEHLDTFLEQIFRVKRRIDVLEEAFEMVVEIQHLLCHLKVLKHSAVLSHEVDKQDQSALQSAFQLYHNLLDDMRTRGFSDLMKQIVEYEEKLIEQEEKAKEASLPQVDKSQERPPSEDLDSSSNMSSKHKDSSPPKLALPTVDPQQQSQQPPQLTSLTKLREAIAPHKTALTLMKRTYGQLEQSLLNLSRNNPRFVPLSMSKLCDMVFAAQQGTVDFESLFPEVVSFVSDKGVLGDRVVGVKGSAGDVMTFDRPVRKHIHNGEDVLEFFKESVAHLETEILGSLRGNICKSLNFLLQTSYNFDKFFHNVLEHKISLQSALISLRALVVNDLSLILENAFVPTPKEAVNTRLAKYMSQYNSALKRFSFVTYREIMNEGDPTKQMVLESFLIALMYNYELVTEIIKRQELSFSSFYWQSTLKVCLRFHRDKSSDDWSKQTYLESFLKTVSHTFRDFDGFPNLLSLAYGGRQIQPTGFELNVSVFDKSIDYGFQLVRDSHRLNFLPHSEQTSVTLHMALCDNLKSSIRGSPGSGKTGICLHLAQLCGRHLTVIDASASGNPHFVSHNFILAASQGSWMMIKRLEDADLQMIETFARVALIVKKQQEIGLESSHRRVCQLDKLDFNFQPGCRLIWSQSWETRSRVQFGAYIPFLSEEFRCNTLVSLDLFTFVHASLLDLAHVEDFDLKTVDSLARQLHLFFQLLQRGLCDKAYLAPPSTAEAEFGSEALVMADDTWRYSLDSTRVILSQIKFLLKSDAASRTPSGVFTAVYRAVYQNLKYQLNPLQKHAMMLTFISVFDPSQELFTVNDSNFEDEAVTLHSFFTANKMPSFSNLTTVEKLHALVDNWSPSSPLVLINYGENLESYSDSLNKVSLFLFGRRMDTTLATGRQR